MEGKRYGISFSPFLSSFHAIIFYIFVIFPLALSFIVRFSIALFFSYLLPVSHFFLISLQSISHYYLVVFASRRYRSEFL